MEKQSVAKKHNGIIALWKFLFMMMIAVHHFSLTYKGNNQALINLAHYGGVLGVSFFFVVSGYLMTYAALKIKLNKKSELGIITWKYIWKKIKRFFPILFLTYVILLVAGCLTGRYNFQQAVNSIWNLSFITMSGIRFTIVIDILWYISAMFICMLILYPLIVKYRRNFLLLICPVAMIFMVGYLSHKYNSLGTIYEYNGLFYDGMVRALACMMCGSLSYVLSQIIIKRNYNKFGRTVLTIIESVGFIGMYTLLFFQNFDLSIIQLFLFTVCIAIAFSGKTLFLNIFSNRFVFFLEKLSLSILFTHRIVVRYLVDTVHINGWLGKTIWYCFATIFTALVVMWIVEILVRLFHKVWRNKKVDRAVNP